ncbi:MAG TPA: hypothetical protein VNC50_02110 [Planctomycetia bacterium]|nr:hypothetical protein [Planctomycetia bacterium]
MMLIFTWFALSAWLIGFLMGVGERPQAWPRRSLRLAGAATFIAIASAIALAVCDATMNRNELAAINKALVGIAISFSVSASLGVAAWLYVIGRVIVRLDLGPATAPEKKAVVAAPRPEQRSGDGG